MTDEEMHMAAEQGVILNVGELSRLEKFGAAYPGCDVCVRVNPQVGSGHHDHVITAGAKSKFGIPVENTDQILETAARHGLTIRGLHQHIGSGIQKTETLWQAIAVILEASRAFADLRFINVGGGLGVPYRPDEADLDMDQFESLIVDPLKAFIASHPSDDLSVWFEPGRYFSAECGTLLTTVNTVKVTEERTFAGTDSGMNHLVRPAMYGAYHEVRNLSNPDGPVQPYDIVGNICESADFFAKDRDLPELREGDILGVMKAGAYGMSMANAYNMRSLPAEIWVSTDGSQRVIRERESAEAVAEREFSGMR